MSPETPRSSRWLRLLAWVLGGVLLLFIVAAAALYFLVPKETIIAKVVPRVESALGRPVHLEDAGISIWPPFGVYLAGLRIEDSLTSGDLMRVDHMRAQLAWRPLLSGEFRFSSVDISGLYFHYEQFDDSTSNLTDLLAGPSGTLPVMVEQLEFDKVQLSGADRRDTSAWAVDDVEGQINLNPVSLEFDLDLSVPKARTKHADSETVYDVPVKLSAAGQVQRNPLVLTLRELEGSVREIPLKGSGTFEKSNEVGALDMQLAIGPAAVPEFIDLLPAERRGALAAYDVTGNLEITANMRGNIDSLTAGGAEAKLTWTDGRIADSTGEWLHFSTLVIPADHEGFHVDADEVVTRFGPVKLAAVGSWPPEGRLELSVAGQSELASFFQRDSAEVSGQIDWSASATGPMTEPRQWQLGARAQLSGVRFAEPGREPLKVDGGEVMYDGETLKLAGLSARYGRSDARLDGTVQGVAWQDYMAQQPLQPQATFHILSRGLDLDALFPQMAGDSAAPADTSSRPPLPSGRARLVIDADTMWLGGARWHYVHGEFTVEGDRCTIDTLYGRVYGGRFELDGLIDSLTGPVPSYEFQFVADSIEVGDLLGRFGSAGKFVRGESHLAANVAGSGQSPSEIVSALQANGTVKLYDAQLQHLNVAGTIQDLLGLKLQDPLPLKSVTNKFRFTDGRAQTDDFKFTTSQATWTLGGSAGLDGSLSYSLGARMSPEQAANVKLPDSWSKALPAEFLGKLEPADLLKDDSGAIDLFFKIGGPFTHPEVAVDWDKLQPMWKSRFESRLKQKLTSDAEKKLKEGLKGLLDPSQR